MGEAAAQPKKQNNTLGCAILVGLLVAAGLGVKSCVFGDDGTSYSATVADFTVVNPADLAVTFHVTNTGKKAGTPECTVQAQDPSYTYHGIDIGKLSDPIPPGETKTTVMNLTISKQGASYVTDATVKCS